LNFLIRTVSLFLAVTAVLIITAVWLAGPKNTKLADCEIARIWIEAHTNTITELESFETFLEERLRIGDIVAPGSLFTGPRYSVAVHSQPTDRVKSYDFLVSRDGVLSSQRSVSISMQEWSRHRQITCDDTNGAIR
jgi:hypothetical protein